MEFEQVMRLRQSCRAYTEEPLTEAEVAALLCAAHQAPVANKKYENVHLTVVRDQAFMEELTRRFQEHVGDPERQPLYHAPLLIIASARAENGEVPLVGMANAACVVDHMHLQATALGLGSVYIYGAMTVLRGCPELVAKLNLPEGFLPASSIVVGHPQTPYEERRPAEVFEVNVVG